MASWFTTLIPESLPRDISAPPSENFKLNTENDRRSRLRRVIHGHSNVMTGSGEYVDEFVDADVPDAAADDVTEF